MEKNEINAEMLSILFEKAPDAIYLNDLKGTFLDGNEEAERITGYKREELIGKSFLDLNLLSLKDLPLAAVSLGKNLLGQSTGPDEFTLNSKNGGQVTVEIRTFPFTFNGKKIVMGIARDISARKNTELELEKTERRMQKLIELSSDAIIVKNDEEVLFSNDAGARLFGFDHAEDIIGHFLDNYYHPEFVDQIHRFTKARRRGEYAPQRYEMKIIRQDGVERDIEIRVTLIDWQGSIVSLGIMRDITDQKVFEERREAVYQLAALLNQAISVEEITQHALDIVSLVMEYEMVSFQTIEDEQLWVQGTRGYEPTEKSIPVNGVSIAAKAARLKTTLNIPDVSKDPDYYEASPDSKSELIVPIILGDVVYGVFNVESGKLNAFTREDEILIELLTQHMASALERVQRVTERLAYERELLEGQLRLEKEKELNQLKTRFMSTATHEIRTPLSSIQGYTEIIQYDHSNLTENQRQYFKVILRNVHRLSVLTDDLLDLQKLEEGKMAVNFEPVNVKELLLDVLNEFKPILEEKKQTVHCNCLDYTLRMDRLRLMQVIVNLLSNASKFSPEGTRILLNAEKIGDWGHFSITDFGVGISEDDMSKLFIPFPGITVDGNVRGTGLGLSISKGIVELHGGEIWAESDGLGKGTTISFSLPIKK